MLRRNIFTCHNIIAFHSILIARTAKPTSKTNKTIQAKLGSLTKAGNKGKKRSSSSKNIALQISNKQKKNQGSSSKATNLGAATHDNNTDSIVDQDEDDDDVVLASIPNHFFISLQKFQCDVLDNDDSKDNNDDNDNDDNHFGMGYNATVYDGRKNSVAAVHQARLSASPSSANVAASIAPDLSTLSRNGLIAAANEALRVPRSLEHEVVAL